jgi:hypothetical protein
MTLLKIVTSCLVTLISSKQSENSDTQIADDPKVLNSNPLSETIKTPAADGAETSVDLLQNIAPISDNARSPYVGMLTPKTCCRQTPNRFAGR